MNLKKILAFVSALAVLGVGIPCENFNVLNDFSVSVSAEELTLENGLKYEVNEDGTGITITDCEESVTEIEIPAEIDGLPVTSIGGAAFSDCTSLISITIPDSVTSIGNNAFSRTPLLENQTTDVKYVDKWVIECNTSVTEVELKPDTIGIGVFAFSDCTSLISITIPDSVTSIGWGAFSGCTSLTSITIPDSVTNIDNYVFARCISLTEINVDKNNKCFYSEDGVLFNKDKTEIICYPGGNKNTNYSIPDSVVSIGRSAFHGASLTSITIPDSVTSIGDNAFYYASLTSITIPDSITSIGQQAFYCVPLKSVIIPDSVTSIGGDAFYQTPFLENQKTDVKYAGKCVIDCNNDITQVELKSDTVGIADNAFTGCDSLISITIPDSVIIIGDDAFLHCDSLTSVTIPDSVISIGDGAFLCCNSLTSITIPDSVTSIGEEAFKITSLTSVTIPDSVTSIGEEAFFSTSLTSVTIPNSVTTIGESTFFSCNSLTSITIPNSVTSIEKSAFAYCESLTDVYFQGTEEEWNNMSINNTYAGNSYLLNATIHFSDGTVINEKKVEGDIDGNGETTSNDALNILQFVANVGELTEEQKVLADIDGDGEVTSLDALEILQMVVGL